MNTFEIVDLILFLGISQGIFLAITLRLVQNRNKSANRVLSYILLIASLMLFGRILSVRYNTVSFFRVASLADTVIFIFGPLVYTYIRRLTFREIPEFRFKIVHFVPALVHFVFFVGMFLFSNKEFENLIIAGKLTVIFFSIETIGLLSNGYYCFKSYQLIKVYTKEEKNNFSYSQNISKFLMVFLSIIGVFLLIWILSYVNTYFFRNPKLSFLSYHAVWVFIPVLVYVVGFYSLKQPEIFRVVKLDKKRNVPAQRIGDQALKKLKKDLEDLIVEDKIYLNNNLTLTELADKLKTSPNNLSWLLNNIHNCSFYDYINRYRVRTFIDKIQKGQHHRHTILALSLDSGFNSKSTFNKAFKTEMKDTPSNYIKTLSSV